MRRELLALFRAGGVVAMCWAATPQVARADATPDSTVISRGASFHVDTLAAGGTIETPPPPMPTRPVSDSIEKPKGPVFVDFLLGWHRPESQHGDLTLNSRDYGAIGFGLGGYPLPWLEIIGDLDVRWAFFQGPQLATDPFSTIGSERSLSTSFAGITGRFKWVGRTTSPYAELGLGIVSSTMSADGVNLVGIWPLIFSIPFTERVHAGDAMMRVGIGVTFPRKSGVEVGFGAKYYSLAQAFGRLGRANVGGLTCNFELRTEPMSWFGRHRGSHSKK